MACEYTCDGCGKKAPGAFWPRGAPGWHKPNSWFQRQDNDGPQDCCSRECIDKVAAKTGKTSVVLPI